tara:strand:+ start:1132 stop:1851 length:720 start_codon:yes stop_codon:yes gene_type:complete
MKLIKGDCLEVMKTIESGSIDAIITDPPYGTTACKWDSVIPFDLMWEQLNRIIKPNGAIVLFGSEPFSSALRMSNIKNYKYDWIWQKNKTTGFLNAKKQPMNDNENILVFYIRQCLYNPQKTKAEKLYKRGNINGDNTEVYGKQKEYIDSEIGTRYPKRIQYFNNNNNEKRLHPTQKPVALMEYLIKTYTNEGETVLDFTMGSCSTGVAAKNTNRNFIGIEQDEKYFAIAEDRINNILI